MKESAVCCGATFKDVTACPVCERHYVRDMDKKSAICMYLKNNHTGKSRAIHSRDLQRLFSIDGRTLRRKVSALRQDGIFIYCLLAQAADETGPYFSVRLTGKRVCQWIPFVEVADYGNASRIWSPNSESGAAVVKSM